MNMIVNVCFDILDRDMEKGSDCEQIRAHDGDILERNLKIEN